MLPFLDEATIVADPTILMGYSDTTTLLAAVRRFGLVTYHGPSVMAGLSQMGSLPPGAATHVRDVLFGAGPALDYPGFERFAHGYPDWRDPANVGLVQPLESDGGPRALQGHGRITGELYGGCIEVLDWLRGTSAWPVGDEWAGRLLFLETSEEKPSHLQVERILRSFGVLGTIRPMSGSHSRPRSPVSWPASSGARTCPSSPVCRSGTRTRNGWSRWACSRSSMPIGGRFDSSSPGWPESTCRRAVRRRRRRPGSRGRPRTRHMAS